MIATAFVFVVLAVLAASLAITLWVRLSGTQRYLRRLEQHPLLPAAQTPDGSARIRGRVMPSEQGVITSPLTGREGVVFRVDVDQEIRSSKSHSTWRSFHVEKHSREFWVDDGSVTLARIVPKDATMMVDPVGLGRGSSITPEQRAWVTERAGSCPASISIEERCIAPGESLTAIGPCQRRALPDSPPELVLWNHEKRGHAELFLTTFSDERLVDDERRNIRGIKVVFAIATILFGLAIASASLAVVLD